MRVIKHFSNYTDQSTPLLSNYIFSAIAGTTWFLQFFFYGMGESKLGNGPSSWILHMAFIILIANTWGLVLKEWKGVAKKTLTYNCCRNFGDRSVRIRSLDTGIICMNNT